MFQTLDQGIVSEGYPNVGNIRFLDDIAFRARQVPVVAEPVSLDLHLEATLNDTVPCQLAHVCW